MFRLAPNCSRSSTAATSPRSNQLDLAMVTTTLVMHHVKVGRLRALALVGRQRQLGISADGS